MPHALITYLNAGINRAQINLHVERAGKINLTGNPMEGVGFLYIAILGG